VTFNEILSQTIAMLHQHGRVSYRALKRQFAIQDDYLEDLKDAIFFAHPEVIDEEGRGLVWTGDAGHTSAATVAPPGQAPRAYTPPYLAERILTSKSALEGERKQVTVLFADLKGSTELIRDLDPEAAQRLLDPALQRMMDAVHHYEGTVNQVLGDGIMALFGAPVAHEDHAARACYAALAMQTAMRRYAEDVRRSHGLEIQARVGLNSGEVVVRAIGNDLHMDYSAVGQTTHLAARMEQLATPGSIRLTAPTLRLAEGLVQVNALGRFPVKGLTEPVEVFELVGASAIRGRLQASAARGLTRFVGRQQELEALHQALEQAGAGQGQVVAVVGEAGQGKSRLAYEFVHSHHTSGWSVLESASVSYGKATPYFPVIDLLKRYCHIDDHDDTRAIQARVTGQVLTLDPALQDTVLALLSLLDALSEDNPFVQLDPPQRRQRTLDALKRVLLRESQVQPLLLVFEDLHWIDAETQALLDSLVESLPTARLLLLVNYRPEYQHSWGGKTYYTQLRLDPLPPVSVNEFLQALLGDDPSLQPLKQLLIARTEGNPFFLEESLRTLVETEVLVGEPGAYRLVHPLASLQMPATVQAVLAARIDRLTPEEKRLLQTAAVIGNEVPLPLLQAIAELPEASLQRGLAHLQAAEFLYEMRLFPEREYTFKHALTHEVAYGSLLHERRRVLHARIVEALECLVPDRLAEQVERLAHHALRGEVWDKAQAYCRQAGAKAFVRSALREVVGYFEQALVALQHRPDQRHIQEQAIDLRLALGLYGALFALGEYRQILVHLREADTLATALGDQRRLGRVSVLMSNTLLWMGDNDRALASAQHALALATALRDLPLLTQAHARLGHVYYILGDYQRALDLLRQVVEAITGESSRVRFGERVGPASSVPLLSRTLLLWSLTEVGKFTEGVAHGEEAVRSAEAAEHLTSLITAYVGIGRLYLRQGDVHKAAVVLERGLRLCDIGQIPTFFILTAASLGYAYVLSGRVAEALPLLERALEEADRLGFLEEQALYSTWLSEAYLLADRQEDALALAQRALTHAREHKERGHEAHALRLLGEIAAQCHPPEVAEADARYRQALALANELGMRPLQAHCHRGLGTLYASVGQQEQARTELSTAIEMYQSMAMTFWLPQAEAALAQVERED
jgi:class 3 adenylate cyclase/tetratricopeptide (TPR) repeat protein